MGLLGEGGAGWTRSVGRGRVDMVDDDDGERLFLGGEFEAGVLRAEDEGGALIVGTDGALREAGEAEGDVVDAGEASLVDEVLVLEGVHDEGEKVVDGGAGELEDDVVAVAPDGHGAVGVEVGVAGGGARGCRSEEN